MNKSDKQYPISDNQQPSTVGTSKVVAFNNSMKAEIGELQDTSEPIAVAAFAQTSPPLARARFPEMTLEDLILKRPYMGYSEAKAFAAACGVKPLPVYELAASEFEAQLHLVIDRYELQSLFGRFPEDPGQHGIDVRPRGKGKSELAGCQRSFASLPAIRQFFAATILWLYVGRRNSFWMENSIHDWKAVDAIVALKKEGALEDWARLIALYPGC